MPSLFRPSSIARIMACPASATEGAKYTPTESVYTRLGTAQHEAAASWLKTRSPPAEHKDDVEDYVLAVKKSAEYGTLWVEQPLHIPIINVKGAADAVVRTAGGEWQVHDRKLPHGRQVSARENPQLACYALGVQNFARYVYGEKVKNVRLVIHQGERIDYWVATQEWLDAFAVHLHDTVQAALRPEALFNPGADQCRYCPALANCGAVLRQVISVTDKKAEMDQGKKQDLVELVTNWAKAVEAETFGLLKEGKSVTGWKIVEGRRPNRAWFNETEAAAALTVLGYGQQIYKQALISPAQADKLVKDDEPAKAALSNLTVQGQPSLTLAKEGDRRPAVNLSDRNQIDENMFDKSE